MILKGKNEHNKPHTMHNITMSTIMQLTCCFFSQSQNVQVVIEES